MDSRATLPRAQICPWRLFLFWGFFFFFYCAMWNLSSLTRDQAVPAALGRRKPLSPSHQGRPESALRVTHSALHVSFPSRWGVSS